MTKLPTKRFVAELAHTPPSVKEAETELFDLDKAAKTGEEEALKELNFGDVRPFPLHVFPPFFQEFVTQCNDSLLHPIDFSAASVLWTVGAATGNGLRVKVKAFRYNKACFFMCLVGRPNSMKTEPQQICIRPLYERNQEEYKNYQNRRIQHGETADPIIRHLVDDYTPEAFTRHMDNNKHGVSVWTDEFSSFVGNFGRYSGGSEVENWLKIWSNVNLNVDRLTKMQMIKNPFSNILGGTQYDTLRGLFREKKELLNKGFFDRCEFVAPNGLRKQDDNDKELDGDLYRAYKSKILTILDESNKALKNYGDDGVTITMMPEAKKIIDDWKRKLTARCNAATDRVSSMLGKYDIKVYRFALALQVMEWVCNRIPTDEMDNNIFIEADAAKGAVELANYFIENALKVHNFTTNQTAAIKLDSEKLKWYCGLKRENNTRQDCLNFAEKLRSKGLSGLSEAVIYTLMRRNDLFEKVETTPRKYVYNRVA